MKDTKRKHTRRNTKGNFSELGEGRSKSIYIEPQSTDTAVMIAFYNPAGFKRILNNILYVIHTLKEKKIPYFVVECVFPNRKPQIPNADLVLHSKSYMFYKEQLLNALEKIIPGKYTKLVAMDGDIIFDAPDWLDQISVMLNTKDIIQPYLKACWLMPDNTRIRAWKYGIAYAHSKHIARNNVTISKYHPGFAWAFRRSVFKRLGGFYPNALIGGGDSLFMLNFFYDTIPESWIQRFDKALNLFTGDWATYHTRFKEVNPTLGHLNIKAMHLFHGLILHRQYGTRYSILNKYANTTWDNVFKVNDDGLTEFIDPKMNTILLKFFKQRNEDVSLKHAMRLTYGETKKVIVSSLNKDTDTPIIPEEMK
ncbi:MAG: hypothetical protein EBU66_16055 [Bacteroidetes bacterium]|nr:hypothetical protein [bacterium]NBP66155.1 hypothetical protein [Bacteroidota bacterium]